MNAENVMNGLRVAILCDDDDTGKTLMNACRVLQHMGHQVDIYTSNMVSERYYENLSNIYTITPPFSAKRPAEGKIKQPPLIQYVQHLYVAWGAFLNGRATRYDVFLVSTSVYAWVPALRVLANRRVVLYYAHPDDALDDWEFDDAQLGLRTAKKSLLARIYRIPIEWAQGWAMSHADLILANSHLATRLFCSRFPSQTLVPRVVYPCSMESPRDATFAHREADTVVDTARVISKRPTYLAYADITHTSNLALAIRAFARLRQWQVRHRERECSHPARAQVVPAIHAEPRLVIAGACNPLSRDDTSMLNSLQALAATFNLSYAVIHPEASSLLSTTNAAGDVGNANISGEKTASATAERKAEADEVDVLFLPNISSAQRISLLNARPTRPLAAKKTESEASEADGDATSSPQDAAEEIVEPTGTIAILSTASHAPFVLGCAEEAMVSHGIPVLACDTSGSTELIVDPARLTLPVRGDVGPSSPPSSFKLLFSSSTPQRPTATGKGDKEERHLLLDERTGWLRPPDAEAWAGALRDILITAANPVDWYAIRSRCQARAQERLSPTVVGPQLERALLEAVGIDPDVDAEEEGESWWVFWLTCYVLGFFLVWLLDMHEVD